MSWYVQYAPFGVADAICTHGKTLPTFFLSSMTTALGEDTAPSFSRGAYVLDPTVVTFALPSVACFILGVSVDAFKSSMTSIFMCPTALGALLFLSEGTSGKLLSAMTRTEVLRWLHAGFLVRIDFGKIQKCQLFHIHFSCMPLCKNCSRRHHWHATKIKLC